MSRGKDFLTRSSIRRGSDGLGARTDSPCETIRNPSRAAVGARKPGIVGEFVIGVDCARFVSIREAGG